MIVVWADFNGVFDKLLCLSHEDFSIAPSGEQVNLREGMQVTAYMEDADEAGEPEFVMASGTVRRSPVSLQCKGSRWALEFDGQGIRHEKYLPSR
jgi:hypothetical protein